MSRWHIIDRKRSVNPLRIPGGNVASDVRSLYMRSLRSMPLTKTSMFLYPRMVALHNLPDKAGFAGPNGRLEHPTYMRASYAYMVADGAYMIGKCARPESIVLTDIASMLQQTARMR